MRGHTEIQQMRLLGKTPKAVFLNDYPCSTNWFETGEHATVCVENDAIAQLDFRFLSEVTVHISSLSVSRAKRLFERAKEFGASVVAASSAERDENGRYRETWFEIYRKETV